MFGGLHIEKLLLEIHGQLIDGSGLSELIDVSNVSISGGGNVLVNVPQITSAKYLLQACVLNINLYRIFILIVNPPWIFNSGWRRWPQKTICFITGS